LSGRGFSFITRAAAITSQHPNKPELRITLPMHNRELKRRTLESILDQSGLTAEEFLKLL